MPRRGTKKEYTMKRKLFTLFVAALALVCLVLPMTVGAADDPTISLVASTEKVYRGDTFTVDVVVANNPGYWGPTVNVAYDGDKVELTAIAKGTIYAAGALDADISKNPVALSINDAGFENNTENGTLVTMTFKAKADGEVGTAAIKIDSVDAIDADEVAVAFATVDTTVDVHGKFDTAALANATVKYNGRPQSLTVTGIPSANVAYTYNDAAVNDVTAVGTYKVVAKISAPYYDDKELTATLTIEPAELILRALDVTGGTATLEGICLDEDVKLDFTKITVSKKDDKWIASNFELTGADAANYTLTTTEFELTVNEATDLVTVTIVRDVDGTPETLETLKFVKGSTAVINAPAVEDYRFAKWGDGKTDNPLVIKNIVGDAEGKMTLVAFYNKIQYINITVMQKLGDNDATVVKGPFKHEKNTAYTVTAEKVVNKDFVFKQWEYENGDKISTDEKIDILPVQDTTLVAVYDEDTNAAAIAIIIAANNKKKVTISFDTMGAAKIPAQELKKGELATMPATPKKDGYVFAGWYVESTYKTRFDFMQPVEESATLTAKWVGVSRALIMTIDSKVASAFGKTVENDVAPIIVKNRTMLPARFVAENLGAKVEWNAAKRQATITGNGVTIVLTIDSTTATVNGKAVTLDSPAFIQNDRTYTPVRFIAEALGAQVEWNATTRQAVIIK